jgi:acyl carrier protein
MKREISREEIVNKLKDVLSKRFRIDLRNAEEHILDEEFLGSTFMMAARDLLYVFYDVEREFGITIPQEDIGNGRFKTFNNVADIIHKEVNK